MRTQTLQQIVSRRITKARISVLEKRADSDATLKRFDLYARIRSRIDVAFEVKKNNISLGQLNLNAPFSPFLDVTDALTGLSVSVSQGDIFTVDLLTLDSLGWVDNLFVSFDMEL